MEIVSLALLPLSRSAAPDREERRERRNGARRRKEDTAPVGAAECAGPSLAFLAQVASQMRSETVPAVNGYAPRPWRCGVIADERA